MDILTNLFEIGGTLVLILLIIWVSLAVFSRLRYQQAIGRPFFGRPLLHRVSFPPPSSWYKAMRAAEERRANLLTFLKRANAYGDSNTVPFEYIERPPFDFTRDNPEIGGLIERSSRRFPDGDQAGYWHRAHLGWQLQENHYLLAERVVDALHVLRVSTGSEFSSTVMLRPLNHVESQKGFPWRVVIATAYASELSERLSSIQDWLGIGLDFEPPVSIQPLGMCNKGEDGKPGIVGGKVITSTGVEYGVTCRHVLSSICPSLHWPNNNLSHSPEPATPDAVLIKLKPDCRLVSSTTLFRFVPFKRKSGCFVSSTTPSHSIPCSKLDIPETVVKSPSRKGRLGRVNGIMNQLKVGDTVYRAPHLHILPHFYKRFGILWPLGRRRFSVPGDSGSWVIDTETGDWAGMIIGGDEHPHTSTYAIRADFLLETFENYLGSNTLELQVFGKEKK